MSAWAAVVALAWTLVLVGASSTAIVRLRRARSRVPARSPVGTREPVTLVRPCAGAEEGLEERLVSILRAQRSFVVEVRVAVSSDRDGAYLAAERACARLRAAGVDAMIVRTHARAANHKVAQLDAILAAGARPQVLWADSDVDLTGTDLDDLVAPLEARDVAAVWAPPVERGPARTLADRASEAVLGGSLHAFPLLCRIDPAGMVGKLVAAKRDVLREVRFGELTEVLGEDVELARRLRAAGHAVRVAGTLAVARPTGRSPAAVVGRFTRWIAMVRAQRPARLWGYPAVLAATPLVLALAAAGAAAAPWIAVAAAGLAVTARAAVAVVGARAAGRAGGVGARLVDMLLADTLLLVAFTCAVVARRVTWRGRSLRLGAGGRLQEVSPVNLGRSS